VAGQYLSQGVKLGSRPEAGEEQKFEGRVGEKRGGKTRKSTAQWFLRRGGGGVK